MGKFTAVTMDKDGRFYASVFDESDRRHALALSMSACGQCGHTLVCVYEGTANPMNLIGGDGNRNNDERRFDTSGFLAYLVGGAIGAACLLFVGLSLNEQDAVSMSIGMMLYFIVMSVAYRASLKPT